MQNPVILIYCVAVTVLQAAGRTIRDITRVAVERCILVVDSRVVAPEHTAYIIGRVAVESCILVVDGRVVAPRPTTTVSVGAATDESSSDFIADKLYSTLHALHLCVLLSV